MFSDKDTAAIEETVTFDASASRDPDGDIVNYIWDFGDGEISETTDPSATYAYSVPGTFIISLTAVDDGGETATNEASLIFVRVNPPV